MEKRPSLPLDTDSRFYAAAVALGAKQPTEAWHGVTASLFSCYPGITPEGVANVLNTKGAQLAQQLSKTLKHNETCRAENIAAATTALLHDPQNDCARALGWPDRYPYDPMITVFNSIAAYNKHEERHPLPDMRIADASWFMSYTGFEGATRLPERLTEQQARQFVWAATSFAQGMQHLETLGRNTPYGKISQAISGSSSDLTPETRDKAFSLLFHKGSWRTTFVGKIPDYLAKIVYQQDRDFYMRRENYPVFQKKLASKGIAATAKMNRHTFLPEFTCNEVQDDVSPLRLLHELEQIPGACYRGLLMSGVNSSKPQYTQPMLLGQGVALQATRELMPGHELGFDILQELYRSSGLEDATRIMRRVVSNEQTRHRRSAPAA